MSTRITALPPNEPGNRPPTAAELNAGVDLSRAFTEVTITSRRAERTVRLIGAQARSLGASMTVLHGTLQKIAEQAATVTQAADEVFAEIHRAPKNLPHDPSLRKDRRKWGGR